jgi:CDP-6-deoxy-D-xylo-4-hexulose-3-dehydrase
MSNIETTRIINRQPIYPLASSTWNSKEEDAAIGVIKSGKCTMGPLTKLAEQQFADLFGSKYCVMSNSGSSANLLAITALMYRKHGPSLKPGDVVLVPTVSWSTTYYPLHQNGLVMKFIDVDLNTLNISPEEIKKHITPEVKAIFAVNLLGNPCDFDALMNICQENNLILVEDNCESMGSTYRGKQAGSFGVMGTHSGFFSHIICSVEAGYTVTDDEELQQLANSLRAHGWTRTLPDKNFVCDKTGVPFEDLFRFCLPGYNLRTNDIFAAITSEQLIKLPNMIRERKSNADYFKQLLSEFNKNELLMIPQEVSALAESTWFGFSMILNGRLAGKRKEVTEKLLASGVECRPIVAGNITNNPVIALMRHQKTSDKNASRIDTDGFFIGNNPDNLTGQLNYFFEVMESFK